MKRVGNVRSKDEELKNIPVCELFFKVAMYTTWPLPTTKGGNRYILVVIDHYSKWSEAKTIPNHGAKIATKFFEDDIICKYGVPRFILIDNREEWLAEFDVMCKNYGITHQFIVPQWPQCNGMAKWLIKTIKHGITVLSTTPEHLDSWDEQLARVMFGY